MKTTVEGLERLLWFVALLYGLFMMATGIVPAFMVGLFEFAVCILVAPWVWSREQ